jgi:hypothetical protein
MQTHTDQGPGTVHIPEDCDTTSGQRQAQNGLGYSDGLEAELTAETQCTVTHE